LQLREESPRHPLALKLMVQCYRALGDDQAALELLPDARKAGAFDESDFRALQLETWSSRIEHGREPPDELLAQVPKTLRREPALVHAYASAEMRRGVAGRALPVIVSALDHGWDSSLVSLYGTIRGEDPKAQLHTAERWLKEHSQEPRLLLTLGRLSVMNEAWSKAREYLETSLRLEQSPEVYAELGRLCTMLGETERGNEYLLRSALPDGEPPASAR
jgi:HemY protein